jgi:methyl-accepting chemotaxis protein
VTNGVDLVNNTGDELKNIVKSIGTISETMGAISESARQQSNALDELNVGFGHLDVVTQQNAGMVDQLAQSNTSLVGNVGALIDQMSQLNASESDKTPMRRAG